MDFSQINIANILRTFAVGLNATGPLIGFLALTDLKAHATRAGLPGTETVVVANKPVANTWIKLSVVRQIAPSVGSLILAYYGKWWEVGLLLCVGGVGVALPDAYFVASDPAGVKDTATGHAVGGIIMLGVGGYLVATERL